MTNTTIKNKRKSKLSYDDRVIIAVSTIFGPVGVLVIIGIVMGASSPHTGGW